MEPPISSSRGPMGSLLVKLDSLLESQQLRRIPVRKHFELLKEDLEGINSFLLDLLDERDPNLMMKYWMKEVREICYDIEDYIDWLIHREAKIRSVGVVPRLKISRLIWPVGAVPRLKISRLPRTPVPRRKIASQIEDLRARLEDAGERHKRYVLDNNTSLGSRYSLPSHWIPKWRSEAASVYVGMDDSKEKLIKLLNNEEMQLNVLCISGFGGIGKTTLAKQLLQEVGGQFECRAFVRVSRKPDTRSLLRSILSQTGCRHHSEACNVQQLIDYLSEHLRHRRYIIVIDDLWNSAVWDFIVRAFPDGTHSSRIIITTTTENIALACCGGRSDYIIKMKPLNDDDSGKLFFDRVFGSENKCPQQFIDASYEIVRKCGGVPLAVILIAGLLAPQQDKSEEWDYVERSLGSCLSISPSYEGMGKVINLSYNGLPQCLKTCLQYVGMYPENCTIWKDDLVRRWVAEGFIEGDKERDWEATAQSHFEELVCRGMIQPIDIDYNDQVLSCTVHHMLLDFVTNKSEEDNFITFVDYSQNARELSSKVRRLFLSYSTAKHAAKPSGITLSQVRSMAFYGIVKCLPSIQEFRFVRILVLHLWGDYNSSTILSLSGIGRLFQLRYLKVTCSFCLQLPTHMGELHCLETLVINAKETSIPVDIVDLMHLVHLCLPVETKQLPFGMSRLRSLRTLKCFGLSGNSDDEVNNLKELSNLEELQLVLTTVQSDNVDRNLKVLFSILGCFVKLKSLVLARGASVSEKSVSITDSSSMSCPTEYLERLELHRATCILSSIPEWIGTLRSLHILKLGVLEIQKNDVDSLAGLQVLMFLSLYVRRPSADQIIFNSGAFPALKCFKFRSGVLCFAFRPGAMPKLVELKLSFNAYSGVEYGHMLVGIEHLLNLQEVSGRIGADVSAKESDKRTAESAFKYTICRHLMIPRLNIQIVDWIDEAHVPAGNVMLLKTMQLDHGVSGGESEGNTSKKDDAWISTFPDWVATSSDVLSSVTGCPTLLDLNCSHTKELAENNIMIGKNIMPCHDFSNVKVFTEDEIKGITSNYSIPIGKDSFGEVYRGTLGDDYDLVAVKRYIFEDIKQFIEEVSIYSQIIHKNVVEIIGYCIGEGTLMIVTKYISSGNLEDILHNSDTPIPLDVRLGIAIGCAEALSYMHSMHSIHGNIKPANILLDGNLTAKLSDFGWSRLLLGGITQYTIHMKRSIDYMDPIFIQEGCLTPRNDVYSFGIVLLELIARKKIRKGDINLIGSFNKSRALGKGLRELFDAEIATENNMKILKEMRKLATECFTLDIHKRPMMNTVVIRLRMLKRELKRIHENYSESILASFHSWRRNSKQGITMPHIYNSRMQLKKILASFKRNLSNFKILPLPINLRIFTQEELSEVTHDVLSGGTTGTVHKGRLDDNTVVAVRMFSEVLEGFEEGFINEGMILSQIFHKNIIRLLGYCLDVNCPAFVYEYASNGSLSDLLDGNKDFPLDLRVKIAVKTAEALVYLHSSATGIIRHGYVVPSKILLDDNFMPKLTGFSWARRFIKESNVTASDDVISSRLTSSGLCNDPIHDQFLLLKVKADVYQFGILLLTLISRKNFVLYANHEHLILQLLAAYRADGSGRAFFDRAVAARGEDIAFLEEIARLALKCICLEVDQRPTMKEVAEHLWTLRTTYWKKCSAEEAALVFEMATKSHIAGR